MKKPLKIVIIVIVILVLLVILFLPRNSYPDLNVVQNVDLNRYQGLWYDIADIPTFYGWWVFGYESTECINQTALYTLNQDGTVHVFNQCLYQGKPSGINGTARFKYPSHNGALQVSFFPLSWADYQIIGLDPDYQWAVVGSPDHNHLWLLDRSPTPPVLHMVLMTQIAEDNGFDTTHLVLGER